MSPTLHIGAIGYQTFRFLSFYKPDGSREGAKCIFCAEEGYPLLVRNYNAQEKHRRFDEGRLRERIQYEVILV